MDRLLQDVRYGARVLRKQPAFAAVAVLALALGIGGNTAIFSVVNGVLLRPLAYRDSGRLMWLSEHVKSLNWSVAPPNFYDWRSQNQVFSAMAMGRLEDYNLTGRGRPERLRAVQMSAAALPMLGVPPALGRVFTAAEDRPGAAKVAVLSHALWARRFGSDPAVVGRTLDLSDQAFTVVGVMPRGFSFPPGPAPADLWVPIGLYADQPSMRQRNNHPGIFVVGRLKPGVTLTRARADLATIAARLARQYPVSNAGHGVSIEPLQAQVVRDVRPALLILLAAVGLLLLLACANVANLLLARAATRSREVALRAALGAGRSRIVRQLLTESVLLALLGGLGGLAVGAAGLRALLALAPTNLLPAGAVTLDGRVLAFTTMLALVTGLVFGLAPALQISRFDLSGVLREGGRQGPGGARHRARNALVVLEVALALMLLVAGGLLLRSFRNLLDTNPGFDAAHVLTAAVSLPGTAYADHAARQRFYERVLQRLRRAPGVTGAAAITPLPMGSGGWQQGFMVAGRPTPEAGQFPLTDMAVVTPDYLRVMGIPLLKGRWFTDQDGPDSPPAVVIDRTFADKYFPGQHPIGRQIHIGPPDPTPNLTVIGVVGHVKNYGLAGDSRVEAYQSYRQNPQLEMSLVVRTPLDPDTLASAVSRAVDGVDPDQPVYDVRPMADWVNASIASRRLTTWLLGGFGLLALVLAGVGIYGVMSYVVAQRTQEIGIRLALGARRSDVMRLIVRQGMTLALAGVAIGMAGALAAGRVMTSLLFRISAADPLTFGSVALTLAAVALAAIVVPGRRATRVDPLVALRYE